MTIAPHQVLSTKRPAVSMKSSWGWQPWLLACWWCQNVSRVLAVSYMLWSSCTLLFARIASLYIKIHIMPTLPNIWSYLAICCSVPTFPAPTAHICTLFWCFSSFLGLSENELCFSNRRSLLIPLLDISISNICIAHNMLYCFCCCVYPT